MVVKEGAPMHEELARWWSAGRAEGRGPRLRAWPIDHPAAPGSEGEPPALAVRDPDAADVNLDGCID